MIRALRSALAGIAALLAAAAPAFADPALWVIKDKDSTIYLLGTVHLLKPDTVWHGPKLDKAIAAATELWLELPTVDAEAMAPQMAELVGRLGMSPHNRLSARLSPSEYKTFDEAAALAGYSGHQLDPYRPWLAALSISNAAIKRAGYDPASGVDTKLETLFRARGITPKGFETAEEQLMIFASMNEAQELDYLRQTLKDYRDAPEELDKMVNDWATADLAGLQKMFVEEMKDEEPELYQSLLVERNRHWVGKIEEMLKGKGVVFIAVGAGHLIGPDSVLAQLKAAGISSTRVQ